MPSEYRKIEVTGHAADELSLKNISIGVPLGYSRNFNCEQFILYVKEFNTPYKIYYPQSGINLDVLIIVIPQTGVHENDKFYEEFIALQIDKLGFRKTKLLPAVEGIGISAQRITHYRDHLMETQKMILYDMTPGNAQRSLLYHDIHGRGSFITPAGFTPLRTDNLPEFSADLTGSLGNRLLDKQLR
jgi:hypothetical protein